MTTMLPELAFRYERGPWQYYCLACLAAGRALVPGFFFHFRYTAHLRSEHGGPAAVIAWTTNDRGHYI